MSSDAREVSVELLRTLTPLEGMKRENLHALAKKVTVKQMTAGRTLFTGRVSNATRLMSIKCSGDTLSDVTFPPHDPQPNVIDGGNAVENPIAPCVVGVFTVMRDAGISAPNFTAASRERV